MRWLLTVLGLCLVGCREDPRPAEALPSPSPEPPVTYGRFVQIAASEYTIYALDESGRVFYHYRDSDGWYYLK